ncbi:flagellar biosynthesis protein FlhF [Paenalcaligenes hominis]|uniref:flagellar biosynthesis protein FlhF n=1 Tax=Paenalcaligenes hominis TaxID=643674 RepID=UPI003523E7EB
MNISRFFGATSREAMRQVRLALGPDALIVSNKRVNGGVEILAADGTTEPEALAPAAPVTPSAAKSMYESMRAEPAPTATPQAERPAMVPPPRQPAPTPAHELMTAISSLKGSLEGRIEELLWSNELRANSNQLTLFQNLLAFGFSTALLRAMLKRLPPNLSLRAAMQWVRKELDSHLPVLKNEHHLWQPGLALALVGPTGVGKTTTLAKLAARAVRQFRAEQVVLITTDTYRIGADTQLKIYADLLHVPIHVVRNAQELRQIMLGLRADQVILIDNVGVSQRDKYVQDQAAMLASAGRRIQRLLVLNAASHGDTLDEVARTYSKDGGSPLAGCVISKVDEASRLGAALDVALRYQLPIHYVSDGQRVPENLRFLNASQLVDMALAKSPNSRVLFAPTTADLAALMTASEVQEQAQHQHAANQDHMIKQVLALSHLADENIDVLRQIISQVDQHAMSATAFDFWRATKPDQARPDLAQWAQNQLRSAVLEATELAPEAPVVMHHIKQRLTGAQSQLYASLVGASTGQLLAMPMLQLSDKKTWYANSGIHKSAPKTPRFELAHALQWAQDHTPPAQVVHWVEEHNNQWWGQWANTRTNVMAMVAPATRCWHVDGHSTPAAISKNLEFYALNYPKMALPYQLLAGMSGTAVSFWYAQAPVELRTRGGQTQHVNLFVLQALNAQTLKEVKTFYCFCLLDRQLSSTPEQLAKWVLQHVEAKNLLRAVGRAYHNRPLQTYTKQQQLPMAYGLELAALFGATAWELDQYKELASVRRVLEQLIGPNAVNQSQIPSSLLKLWNLKDLLQAQHD